MLVNVGVYTEKFCKPEFDDDDDEEEEENEDDDVNNEEPVAFSLLHSSLLVSPPLLILLVGVIHLPFVLHYTAVGEDGIIVVDLAEDDKEAGLLFSFTCVDAHWAEVEQALVEVHLLVFPQCALCMAYKMGKILINAGLGEAELGLDFDFVKLQHARSHYWGHVATVMQADDYYYC